MAACLAHLTATPLSERSDGPEMQRLQDLTVECGSLLVITLVGNPGGFKDLANCNMDEGVVCPDAQPPSFYCDVMVSCWAERLPSLASHLHLALAMFCVWSASCLSANQISIAMSSRMNVQPHVDVDAMACSMHLQRQHVRAAR